MEAHLDKFTSAVDTYVSAWNEPSAERRTRILAEVMHAGSGYVDPNVDLADPAALAEHIGNVLRRDPGRRIVRTSQVQVHHRHGRFHWRLIKGDGTEGLESVDFVEFTDDGRIDRVTGFFGPLTPVDPV